MDRDTQLLAGAKEAARRAGKVAIKARHTAEETTKKKDERISKAAAKAAADHVSDQGGSRDLARTAASNAAKKQRELAIDRNSKAEVKKHDQKVCLGVPRPTGGGKQGGRGLPVPCTTLHPEHSCDRVPNVPGLPGYV